MEVYVHGPFDLLPNKRRQPNKSVYSSPDIKPFCAADNQENQEKDDCSHLNRSAASVRHTQVRSGIEVVATLPVGQKNSDIEVLRAFAIIYTIIVHFKILLPAGSILLTPMRYLDLSVGVDLFLVISGYVITGSILESTRHQPASRRQLMLSFWIKRAFRLLPAAWTWVFIACCTQLVIIAITDIAYSPADVFIRAAAALGNIMNAYAPWCIANLDGRACLANTFLGHYWSLSLEEQFYLVFPLLFFFLSRKALISLLVAAILLQFMWQRPFFTYAWYFKTEALCWGILLALLSQTNLYRRQRSVLLLRRQMATTAGVTLLVLLPVLAANIQGVGQYMAPYGVAVVALICALIVWLASFNGKLFSLGMRYEKFMLYLGSRSYSLYLAHLVVYMTARDLFSQFGTHLVSVLGPTAANGLLVSIALGITLLGAEATYQFVESVSRARGRTIAANLLTKQN